MKSKLSIIIFMAGMILPTSVFADSLEGVVKVVGSAMSRKVMIYSADSQKHKLCRDDESKRVSRLTGMTVKATGDWKQKGDAKSCLTVTAFEVVKTSSGRDAVVGVLTSTPKGFEVRSDSGKVHLLAKVPGGLKKLEGKKVIIDVKPMNTPTGQGASYKVVTYSSFP